MFPPTKFLELSSDVSKPFVIPNVSPLSPSLDLTGTVQGPMSPFTDAPIARDRVLPIVELN